MPRDDVGVIDRIHHALAERTLDVPVAEIVRAGRRRRREGIAFVVVAGVVAVALVVTGVTRDAGVVVAGFAVQDVEGTSAIVFVEPSASMRPTIQPGQVVAVDVEAYANAEPTRGDNVAFALNTCGGHQVFLKRVIGLPGDTVEERDGTLVVNGTELDAPREHRDTTLGPWTVDAGHVFVVGDDLANSNDSRYGLGQIAIGDIIGRVDLSLDVSDANVSPPPTCASAP
jgi:signal peptidase I